MTPGWSGARQATFGSRWRRARHEEATAEISLILEQNDVDTIEVVYLYETIPELLSLTMPQMLVSFHHDSYY